MLIEKNPIKIIYIARNKLLPMSVWISYLIFIILVLIVTFAVPNEIIIINYQAFNATQFIVISVSAIYFWASVLNDSFKNSPFKYLRRVQSCHVVAFASSL